MQGVSQRHRRGALDAFQPRQGVVRAGAVQVKAPPGAGADGQHGGLAAEFVRQRGDASALQGNDALWLGCTLRGVVRKVPAAQDHPPPAPVVEHALLRALLQPARADDGATLSRHDCFRQHAFDLFLVPQCSGGGGSFCWLHCGAWRRSVWLCRRRWQHCCNGTRLASARVRRGDRCAVRLLGFRLGASLALGWQGSGTHCRCLNHRW